DEGAGLVAARRAAAVVEVEVREQYVGHVLRADAERRERRDQVVRRAVHGVDAAELRVVLVAEAGVDEDGAAVAAEEEAPHREGDAVLVVGRDAPGPERLRDDAEHGPAVEAEEAGMDDVEPVATEVHGGQGMGDGRTGQDSRPPSPISYPPSPSSGQPSLWPSPWASLRRRWARATRRRSPRKCWMRNAMRSRSLRISRSRCFCSTSSPAFCATTNETHRARS